MDAISLLISIVGIPIGGFITFIVARCYYLRAAEDLRAEVTILRRQNVMVLRALEAGGIVELNRTDLGEITGLKIYAEAKLSGTSELTGELN